MAEVIQWHLPGGWGFCACGVGGSSPALCLLNWWLGGDGWQGELHWTVSLGTVMCPSRVKVIKNSWIAYLVPEGSQGHWQEA